MTLQASTKKPTPLGNIVDGPPTPPPTDTIPAAHVTRILQIFRDGQSGVSLPECPWTVFHLRSQEYEELLDYLKHDETLGGYVDDKIRYDYSPIQSKFVIRMPSILHETFIRQVDWEMLKTLDRLAMENEIEVQRFIRGIRAYGGKMTIPASDGMFIKHEPDIAYKHDATRWPGVVIEVSYSQKRKDLPDLAEDYLLETNGSIVVMVGLDLDYRKSKQASISVWRCKRSTNDDGKLTAEVEQVVNNQLFRDAEGNPVPFSNLTLSLKDFATENVTRGVPDLPVVIDSRTLCELLGIAERVQHESDTADTARLDEHPPCERKYRLKAPPEELTLVDKEKFQEEEQQVIDKAEELDKSYSEEEGSEEGSSQDS